MRKANTIDYISVMVKWRKLILTNFIVLSILTAIFSLVIPKIFTAKTTILPPTEEGAGFGLSAIIENLPLGKLGIGGMSEDTYTFIAILNSRTVMEAIAQKFNLMKLYETKNMEETVKALRENVDVEINEDGTISLFASAKTGYLSTEADENKTRKLARDMANAFIQELDKVNSQLKTEKARNNRIFIEGRYQQNLTDLRHAEEQLKSFQERHGVIAMPEQTEAAIQAAAELKAKITVKEIAVDVLQQYVSPSHAELSRARKELRELKKKLEEMKTGKSDDRTDGTNGDTHLFIPLNETPDIGLQYVRLYREVTLQQKILEFLLPQYEQARIQEAKDTPTVQVLDEAVMPIKRTSPKRTIMVLLAGTVAIFLSIIFVLSIEYVRNLEKNRPDDYEKFREVTNSLQRDLQKLRFWRSN